MFYPANLPQLWTSYISQNDLQRLTANLPRPRSNKACHAPQHDLFQLQCIMDAEVNISISFVTDASQSDPEMSEHNKKKAPNNTFIVASSSTGKKDRRPSAGQLFE